MGVHNHEIVMLLLKLLKHVPLCCGPSIGWAIWYRCIGTTTIVIFNCAVIRYILCLLKTPWGGFEGRETACCVKGGKWPLISCLGGRSRVIFTSQIVTFGQEITKDIYVTKDNYVTDCHAQSGYPVLVLCRESPWLMNALPILSCAITSTSTNKP